MEKEKQKKNPNHKVSHLWMGKTQQQLIHEALEQQIFHKN